MTNVKSQTKRVRERKRELTKTQLVRSMEICIISPRVIPEVVANTL